MSPPVPPTSVTCIHAVTWFSCCPASTCCRTGPSLDIFLSFFHSQLMAQQKRLWDKLGSKVWGGKRDKNFNGKNTSSCTAESNQRKAPHPLGMADHLDGELHILLFHGAGALTAPKEKPVFSGMLRDHCRLLLVRQRGEDSCRCVGHITRINRCAQRCNRRGSKQRLPFKNRMVESSRETASNRMEEMVHRRQPMYYYYNRVVSISLRWFLRNLLIRTKPKR